MFSFDLNGIWSMSRVGENKWINGTVPGSVYNDILNAGKMEDPFYRDNEKEALKISNYDYEYKRNFILDTDICNLDNLILSCDGLDTLAEIYINNIFVARTENMHRTYEFDIKKVIHPGENLINIIFRSPVEYITEKHKEKPIWSTGDALEGISHLRKAHYMFGWDWGPHLPDMGIWRNISIKGYNNQRLQDVLIRQEHKDEKVKANINIKVQKMCGIKSEVRATITGPTNESSVKCISFTENSHIVTFEIEKPELWWPAGYGKQPLYIVNIELLEDENVIDSKHYRIGLRALTVNQKDDQWGRSFTFNINGIDIFSMGADYIPEDNILARCNKEKTEKLIRSCVQANFNTLRVWGGGLYPEDHFYDLCDEYGLIVWQDLMFACALYVMDEEFEENIRQEAYDNLRRIRHHASLGLICGNNEMEWGMIEWGINATPGNRADYIKQYEYVLPKVAKEVAPDTFYWLASPSSGGSFDKPNDQNFGDVHDWSVWHRREPFTYFRSTYPRYLSEFGLQSFPSLKTVETFTLPEDRNVFSYVMENHQKCASGNEKIMYYISMYYKFPRDFEALLYLSQLIQAEGLKYGVEHWRRNRGRCMGVVFWQLNDCWPVASWASIDYYGRWKALHYTAKRFFAPVLASACEEGTGISLHVTNDTLKNISAILSWKLCDAASKVILSGEKTIESEALTAAEFERLDFANILDNESSMRRHYLEYRLENEKVISEGTVMFVPAKHFEFIEPLIEIEVEENGDEFILTLSSKAYAKSVEINFKEVDAVLSDNYFDLTANRIKKVIAKKAEMSRGVTLEELKMQLNVRSLINSY